MFATIMNVIGLKNLVADLTQNLLFKNLFCCYSYDQIPCRNTYPYKNNERDFEQLENQQDSSPNPGSYRSLVWFASISCPSSCVLLYSARS